MDRQSPGEARREAEQRRSAEHCEALLRFLPWFERHSRGFKADWRGASATPAYPEEVEEFFRLAADPFWSDYAYDIRREEATLGSDEAVARADLAQIKSLLTYCVRGERFGEGHWAQMIREGRVLAILRRLGELRQATRP